MRGDQSCWSSLFTTCSLVVPVHRARHVLQSSPHLPLPLARALSILQERACDVGPSEQEEYSRAGQKEHGSHLDREREKAASRAPHGFYIGFMPVLQADALWFPIPGIPACPSQSRGWLRIPERAWLLQEKILPLPHLELIGSPLSLTIC